MCVCPGTRKGEKKEKKKSSTVVICFLPMPYNILCECVFRYVWDFGPNKLQILSEHCENDGANRLWEEVMFGDWFVFALQTVVQEKWHL